MDKNLFLESIEKAFPNSDIQLKSLVDDNDHYEVTIKSPDFANISLINQHRLFNERLKDCVSVIHAISLKTSAK